MPTVHSQPIYLVDQDNIVRDSLRVLLQSHGFPVLDFETSAEFIRVAKPAEGGCLILGFNRNVVDGLDLIEALRKLKWNFPVIFIVGGGNSATRSAVTAAGAFAYLERPIREAALIGAVEEAMSHDAKSMAPLSGGFAPRSSL